VYRGVRARRLVARMRRDRAIAVVRKCVQRARAQARYRAVLAAAAAIAAGTWRRSVGSACWTFACVLMWW
jgi:hypothetical protein